MDAARSQQIARTAFAWLRRRGIIATTMAPRDLAFPHDLLRPTIQWHAVTMRILDAYTVQLDNESRCAFTIHLHSATASLFSTAQDGKATDQDDDEMQRCRHAFARLYVGGDALPKRLQAYLIQCARSDGLAFKIPLASVVQSTGFGKSRLLCELASRTAHDPESPLRVFYTCLPSLDHDASRFPQATSRMSEYLFPRVMTTCPLVLQYWDYAGELATTLVHLYAMAMDQWTTIGHDWCTLFDDKNADASICERLHSYQATNTIDRARGLLAQDGDASVAWLARLQCALLIANARLGITFGENASVLGVLVDTDATLLRSVPREVQHPRTRQWTTRERAILPPFVLTHTMDICLDGTVSGQAHSDTSHTPLHKQLVTSNATAAWQTLVAMGRPLWDSIQRESPSNVVQLAGNMLLGGASASQVQSFHDDSLHGVASLLCRLGLRPSTWSPLASQAVAQFGAILQYVNDSCDQLVTTYASDPILTFGAARVWYQSASIGDIHATLANHILPTFRKLLRQRAVDTGALHGDVLVGCMLLLLAMDATGVVVASPDPDPQSRRQYAGEWYSVGTFLDVLHGDHGLVLQDAQGGNVTSTRAHSREAWRERWRGWQIGFSHFVPLTKAPDDSTLWALLARRAAGILTLDHTGADLVLPIFNCDDVSLVVVHVVNRAAGDIPSLNYRACTATSKQTSAAVVRVYMNVRGPIKTTREPLYLLDPGNSAEQPDPSFVLCLRGLDTWSAKSVDAEASVIPVLSKDVAMELRKLLEPWSEPLSLIDADHAGRKEDDSINKDAIRAMASRALATTLLQKPWLT